MKVFLRIIGGLMALFVLAVAGLLVYLKTAIPNVGDAQELEIEGTAEQIERGRYLAHSVCVCMDCHSERDWNSFAGPLVAGTLGKGGELFDQKVGLPGSFTAKNITPYGLAGWTNGEIHRAVTTGVSKDGHALFPIMPYLSYGKMDPEDVKSVIAYIRTLSPQQNQVQESKAAFPMDFIINTIPTKQQPMTKPDTADVLAYGEYLMTIAACAECHTPQEKGTPVPGKYLAGGFAFRLPTGGTVFSSNITPDLKTGIGSWGEEKFVRRFKAYDDSTYVAGHIEPGDFNTVMPWTMYATMTESDLKAIYAYLKTVPAVENQLMKFIK